MRRVVVLGATGSIGRSCLDVISRFPDRFKIVGLAAGRNMELLAAQAALFKPRMCAVMGAAEAEVLRRLLPQDLNVEIVWGREGLCRVAALEETDIVVSAIVGAAGLAPTWTAVRSGKRVALANKETLVMAGELIMAEARKTGAEILPVDSEHSAIFQTLSGQRLEDVKRLILTASGGPFLNLSSEELARVTPRQALAHPRWRMGAKISIDSSTLMNKGLEAIEARWLFGLPWDRIAIHIHPQSIVHSLVEFIDGAVLAQLGRPDMRVPIAYALSYPARLPLDFPALDLVHSEPLTFAEPDEDRFPCLALALAAGRLGGAGPTALNAANEVAVEAFLLGEISFSDLAVVVATVVSGADPRPLTDLEQIMDADRVSRTMAREVIARIKGDHS
ncbi:MAG: 1-deoxy-D-xylulose-5-phosphate reductoisomerase [Deltaproteobacteria bacterium]|nr:1-deoxy-D-xylulose-5-phosphate reductoisomerase [Deltaproteobacteria bacterium]